MAEGGEEVKATGKSKFLSKSKWGKVFREREEHEITAGSTHPAHTNSFKLTDDVADFLKPSTERAAAIRPKLDVAIAQRWPNAHEVRDGGAAVGGGSSGPTEGKGGEEPDVNSYRKPRRRAGLMVSFARTAPDVIGEGGDESLDSVSEIGRLKARVGRSVSDRRPNTLEEGSPWPGGGGGGQGQQRLGPSPSRQPGPVDVQEGEDFQAPPLRRAQTSHNEFSPAVQKQLAQPPLDDRQPTLPVLNRNPQGPGPRGYNGESQVSSAQNNGSHDDYSSRDPRSTVAHQNSIMVARNRQSRGLSPAPDPDSLGERRRSMRMSEAMAFRHASAIVIPDEPVNAARRDFATGVLPSPQQYDNLSRPDAPLMSQEYYESPQSTTAPASFADPRNPRSRPGQATQDPRQQHVPYQGQNERSAPPPAGGAEQQAYRPSASQSQPSSGPPQVYRSQASSYQPPPRFSPSQGQQQQSQQQQGQRPYVTVNQPPNSRLQTQQSGGLPQISPISPIDVGSVALARGEVKQNHGHNAQAPDSAQRQRGPPPRAVQPPSAQQQQPPDRQRQTNEQASYMRPQQSSGQESLPGREVPVSSRQPDQPQSASSVPVDQRTQHEDPTLREPQPYYTRPNGSNSSLNRAHPHSSIIAESPTLPSTRENSPPPHFTGSTQQPPSDKGLYLNRNPQDRPYVPGATTRSRGPSASGAQPNIYPSRNASASLSGSDIPHEPAAQRPDSAASGKPYQNFSVPRTASSQAARSSPIINVQHDDGRASSGSPGQRPPQNDYFQGQRAPSAQSSRSPGPTSRQQGSRRPSVTDTARSVVSPLPPVEGNPAADAAYADFAARVAHMKGVFRLTAERTQPIDRCSPHAWLRAAAWWYLKGKIGIETLLQQRRNEPHPQELLMQPHVDLAKTWWILSDLLDRYDGPADVTSPAAAATTPGANAEALLRQSTAVLSSSLKALCLMMGRNQVLPPHQSLIQGQDTTIWHQYPRFNADAAAALGGASSRASLLVDQMPQQPMSALEVLPLGDTRAMFSYSRFAVDVSMSTEDAATDRVMMPCILSTLRGRRDFQTTVSIASQSELINIRIGPRTAATDRCVSWQDVSWKGSTATLHIHLPRGVDIAVRMPDRDFRSLWNLVEYSRNLESNLRPAASGEEFLFETRLSELQYADSTGSNAFPQDKVRGCLVMAFERFAEVVEAGLTRRHHYGYRLLVATEPGHKSLYFATHEICRSSLLLFEFMSDSSANGLVAMIIRIREEQRQCRILLVFPDVNARQALYDVLNGLNVAAHEESLGETTVSGMNIEVAAQAEGFAASAHPALASLEWQGLGITLSRPSGPDSSEFEGPPPLERLRFAARHSTGCITDHLSLGKGELRLRLPNVDTPTIQMLRNAHEDLSMAIDTRRAHPSLVEGLTDLLRTAHTQPTIRTLTFTSPQHLHTFQAALTGFHVRYDGLASTFSISRRRMVVSIHKKWTAAQVRLQLVSRGSVVNLLAFMEDFTHADALCFQVKATDVFELVKGNGKDKKHAVKLVEAKFSLPPSAEREKSNELDPLDRVRRRFVNLEGLDLVEEHDDILVGFDSEEDRDRFASALPADATASKGLTLKRRI